MEEETEVVVPETTEEIVIEDEVEENVENIKAELAKAKELADNYKVRAEKAERKSKGEKVEKNEEQSLSTKDTLALVSAKVSIDDIDEVQRVAKILGKSISETLRDKTMQSILAERNEERNTAVATQTGKTQRGVSKVTGADLLSKAELTGEVPDTEEGLQNIFLARQARRTSR